MLRLHSLDELYALTDRPATCLAIGVFDGVHRGHQQLLRRALEIARSPEGGGPALRPAVFTFQNNPLTVLRPVEAPPRLSRLERRLDWIETLGIDLTLAIPFDESLSRVEAMDFLRGIVVEGFGAKVLVCGPDFRFGHQGMGDAEFVKTVGPDLGLTIETVPPVFHLDAPISSSRIRRLIVEGHVADAAELLGRPHEIEATVIEGKKRGKTIGFPTANLRVPTRIALPRTGVYAVEAEVPLGDGFFGGMMNLGYSPTFGDIEEARLEVHLFDFSSNLAGKTLRVRLIDFMREEIHFQSVDELVEQLHRDETQAREIVGRWKEKMSEPDDEGEH